VSIRSNIKGILRRFLKRYGYDILPQNLVYDWQSIDLVQEPRQIYLPDGAREFLTPDNPELLDLKKRYRACSHSSCGELLWTDDRVKPDDILYFRGHNAYVFQEGSFNRNLFGYLLAYYYAKSIDRLGLLDILKEDTAFGVITYEVDGKQVSRDLLDSVLEIYFLENNLGLSDKENLTILDIGAGYGRMAHRMVESFPNVKSYCCTDAVAVSTFISKYYLELRGLQDRTRVLALDTIHEDLSKGSIYLAVNIHSFSECTLDAIEWWLSLLVEKEVPYLMIVPNSGVELLTNDGRDFSSMLNDYGYGRIALEPKYKDPVVQKYAMNPDYYHLFKART